jgi:hypothetical protein
LSSFDIAMAPGREIRIQQGKEKVKKEPLKI